MTATYKKPCESCKGLGWHLAYVDEWAETKERFMNWLRATIAIFWRKP
jgi:hypothetical protein